MARAVEIFSKESLCPYVECKYCVHRVNAYKTVNGEGQCNLELQGRAKAAVCKGRIFFSLSPDRADKYRSWLLAGSTRPAEVDLGQDEHCLS